MKYSTGINVPAASFKFCSETRGGGGKVFVSESFPSKIKVQHVKGKKKIKMRMRLLTCAPNKKPSQILTLNGRK